MPPRNWVPSDFELERERFLEELREHQAPRVTGVFGPAELDGDGGDELDLYDYPADEDEEVD